MALIHNVYDTDAHFKIDPITRAIKNNSTGKNVLIQHDHNSERFTFEVPKLIDGHDMSVSTSVEIHYINIDSSDKTKQNPGVYPVDDLQISPEDENVVTCSWLISQNATFYAGSLNFLLKFKCVDADGNVVYRWNTAIFSGISVSPGMDNGEAIVEEYPDVLAEWEARITALEQAYTRLDEVDARIAELESRITALENANSGDGGGADTITFYVDVTPHTAEEGMTWSDFLDSDYNYESCTCGSGCKQFALQGGNVVYMAGDCDGMGYIDLYDTGGHVTTDAEIKAGYSYSIDSYIVEEEESGTYQYHCYNCGWDDTSDFSYEECPECGEPL